MFRRSIDFVVALVSLTILSPLLLTIAMLVRWRLGSPVFFRQERLGLYGKPFTIVKFRTMLELADPNNMPLRDDLRLSRFGNYLRKSSLDELPELWNVLLGDMSLVGPRPLLTEYLPRYSERQSRRHEVRPGITGWAQVNGRNSVDWPERFEMDVWYVENRSFWLDIQILLLTVRTVMSRHGVNAESHATMPPFSGNGEPAESMEMGSTR